MSTQISQLTQSITSSTGNDFLVVIDSGSLTLFKSAVSSLNSWSLDSGSFLSSSFSSQSLLTDTASFIFTASYSKTASVLLNLYYDGTTSNGTASYALTASLSRTSSFSTLSISSSYAITSSFAPLAANADNVFSTSYALFSPTASTALYAATSSFALTASYYNIDLDSLETSFEQAYGPFTSSTSTSSVWSFGDACQQGIPIIILKDNTDALFKVRTHGMSDEITSGDTTFGQYGYWIHEARLYPITESSKPGIYRTASLMDTLGSSDCYTYIRGRYTVYPCSYGSFTQLLEFKKTGLARGQYILWVCSRMYSSADQATETLFTERLHFKDGDSFGAIDTGAYLGEDSLPTQNADMTEHAFNVNSSSQKMIVIANNPVIQGCMFAPTASWGTSGTTYNFYGNKSGNHGRNYVLPFLVTTQSLVAGFVSASCNFWSGSKYCTASFSASTSGNSVNDVIYAFKSSLPAVGNFWTISTVVQGIPLSSIPIRTDKTSSWIPFT